MLTQCRSLEMARKECGITTFYKSQQRKLGKMNNVKLAQQFLGGDGASPKTLLERAVSLKYLLKKWESLTGVSTNCMRSNQ